MAASPAGLSIASPIAGHQNGTLPQFPPVPALMPACFSFCLCHVPNPGHMGLWNTASVLQDAPSQISICAVSMAPAAPLAPQPSWPSTGSRSPRPWG